MKQLKGVGAGKSFVGFARQGRRRSHKRIPRGRAVTETICRLLSGLYSRAGSLLGAEGLVGGAEQGLEVGEGVQAALMLFGFGEFAEGVFRAFEVGLGKLVEKPARFTVL